MASNFRPLGVVSQAEIGVTVDKKYVRFHLSFGGSPRSNRVEFLLLPEMAMAVMRTLQAFRSTHDWPVPDLNPTEVKED
jgi:hypothetical protein